VTDAFLRVAARAVVALVLTAGIAEAQGGPPLETDDPGTPGAGRWELNTAVTLERTSQATAYEAPVGDFNYGLGDRIQLTLEIPLLWEDAADTRVGVGHLQMAVKWRFLDDSSSALAVSVFPRLEVRSPVFPPSDQTRDGSAILLPAELTKAWGPIGVNTEAGYRIVQDGPDEVVYRLAVGYTTSPGLELLSECTGSSELRAATEVICQGGARKDLGKDFTLLVAAGKGVGGTTLEPTRFHLYLGVQSRW
jgi:hypothetical protein